MQQNIGLCVSYCPWREAGAPNVTSRHWRKWRPCTACKFCKQALWGKHPQQHAWFSVCFGNTQLEDQGALRGAANLYSHIPSRLTPAAPPKGSASAGQRDRKDGFLWIHRTPIGKTWTMLLSPKASVRSLHFYMSQLCNLENSSSFSPPHKFFSLHLLALESPGRGTYQFHSRSVICPGFNYFQEGRKKSQDCSCRHQGQQSCPSDKTLHHQPRRWTIIEW